MELARQVVTFEDYEFLREWLCNNNADRIHSTLYTEHSEDIEDLYQGWTTALADFFTADPQWLERQCKDFDIRPPKESKVRLHS